METIRICFDWMTAGELPAYDPCQSYAVCREQGGWCSRRMDQGALSVDHLRPAPLRPIVPFLEFRKKRSFQRWFQNRVREVLVDGRFVMPFRASGGYSSGFVMAGLLFIPGPTIGGEETHFSGPLDTATNLLWHAIHLSKSRTRPRTHPSIDAFQRSMEAKHARMLREGLEREARRKTAESLVSGGLSEEDLSQLSPKMLEEYKRAVLRQEKLEAHHRAEALLLENLSIAQIEEYQKNKSFSVVGSDGTIYKLHSIPSHNVRIDGIQPATLCAVPSITVPLPDQLLAQKLMLETNASEFHRIANRTEGFNSALDSVQNCFRTFQHLRNILDDL